VEFHPQHCNLFMYSSSKGLVKLADMRKSALCDSSGGARVFQDTEDVNGKTFFSEIISSISDIKFTKDGRYIIARDYLTLKIWDINMESKPIKTIKIHEYLRPKLCDLYENDCIFDKFEVNASHNGDYLLTGSYSNIFHVYDRKLKTDTNIEVSQALLLPRKKEKNNVFKMRTAGKKRREKKLVPEEIPDNPDFAKKILHLAWHPQENLIAIGARSTIYLFNA